MLCALTESLFLTQLLEKINVLVLECLFETEVLQLNVCR